MADYPQEGQGCDSFEETTEAKDFRLAALVDLLQARLADREARVAALEAMLIRLSAALDPLTNSDDCCCDGMDDGESCAQCDGLAAMSAAAWNLLNPGESAAEETETKP